MNSKQKLIIEQVDKKLLEFKSVQYSVIPPKGWIYSIRTALKMSMRQLGNKLNITAQSIKEIEEREENGSITIRSLREAGAVLGMKLVYGFVPHNEKIEKMIDKRATELAREIVLRTSQSMKLEDQENKQERLKIAISDKANEIKDKMPKYLWD